MFTKKQLKKELSFYQHEFEIMHFSPHDDYRREMLLRILNCCEKVLSSRCTLKDLAFICRCLTRIQRLIRACGYNIEIFDYTTEQFVLR